MPTLTIGKLAQAADVGIETIRFYEREGLLTPQSRSRSGYRHYSDEAVARLRFIRMAKRLGFTLREIQSLLALRVDPRAKRSSLKAKALAKIADIETRIEELTQMKRALTPLVEACDGLGPLEGCPILDALEHPTAPCHAKAAGTTK
ncbi:heavy metal-responsive transcriptional regulator [Planctomyces sp. SH-PL14]|uniref:heavy metal-responsive transcriptional regulator n=1 Tax=Planctomyces sp. SH-PL14 TaxID=1632864 RepID=UPI00078D29B3|nr:heavy metal-responsive transcriptional regulator [Planctomyces sp. SH-PL14]AMV19715.1 HTH-type transcriptional regulator CueR [Planctomyces sp. SH-PL14]